MGQCGGKHVAGKRALMRILHNSKGDEDRLAKAVAAAGDKVRALKQAKAPKSEVDAALELLFAAKAQYTEQTGKEPPKPGGASAPKQTAAQKAAKGSVGRSQLVKNPLVSYHLCVHGTFFLRIYDSVGSRLCVCVCMCVRACVYVHYQPA